MLARAHAHRAPPTSTGRDSPRGHRGARSRWTRRRPETSCRVFQRPSRGARTRSPGGRPAWSAARPRWGRCATRPGAPGTCPGAGSARWRSRPAAGQPRPERTKKKRERGRGSVNDRQKESDLSRIFVFPLSLKARRSSKDPRAGGVRPGPVVSSSSTSVSSIQFFSVSARHFRYHTPTGGGDAGGRSEGEENGTRTVRRILHAPGRTAASPRCPCIWRRTRRTSCAAGSCSPATPGGDPPFRRTRRPRLSAGWKPWLPTRRRGTPSESARLLPSAFRPRSKIVIYYSGGDPAAERAATFITTTITRLLFLAREMQSLRQALGRGAPPSSLAAATQGAHRPAAVPRSAARPASAPRGLGITTPRRALVRPPRRRSDDARAGRPETARDAVGVLARLRALRFEEAGRLFLERARLQPQVPPADQEVRRRDVRPGALFCAAAGHQVVAFGANSGIGVDHTVYSLDRRPLHFTDAHDKYKPGKKVINVVPTRTSAATLAATQARLRAAAPRKRDGDGTRFGRKKERKKDAEPPSQHPGERRAGASHDTGGVDGGTSLNAAGWLMKQGDVVKTWRASVVRTQGREAFSRRRRGARAVVADARRGGREPAPFREGRGGHAEQAARVRAEQPDGQVEALRRCSAKEKRRGSTRSARRWCGSRPAWWTSTTACCATIRIRARVRRHSRSSMRDSAVET